MAIRKVLKILVYIDPVGNENLKSLIIETSAEGEAKLTCVTALESEFTAILSWKQITNILFHGKAQIKGPAGSGLMRIVKEHRQIGLIFSNPGRAGIACYVTAEDFRNAVGLLSQQKEKSE